MTCHLPLKTWNCGMEKIPPVHCVEHLHPLNTSCQGVAQVSSKGVILGGITKFSESLRQHWNRGGPLQLTSLKHRLKWSTSTVCNSRPISRAENNIKGCKHPTVCSRLEIGSGYWKKACVSSGNSGYNTRARHGPVVSNSKAGLCRGAHSTMGRGGWRGFWEEEKQILWQQKHLRMAGRSYSQ